MKWLRRAWKRFIGTLAANSGRESELTDEIEMHLRMQTEDNLERGMPLEEARRAAILKFGAVDSLKERYRDQLGLPALETLARDARYALRAMKTNPGFSSVTLLSLALGIAGATAIFSIVNSTLLRRLPYPHPESLATVSLGGAITAPLYETLRSEARSIENAALFVNSSFDLSGDGEPERIPGARVSAELFDVLGIRPQLGRSFNVEEDRQRRRVVLLGDALWRTRFGADRRVLGRDVILNGAAYTVIGVMPPGFQFPYGPELPVWAGSFPPAQMWRPMALDDSERKCEGCFNFAMIARLRNGIAPAQARAELIAILNRRDPGKRSADNWASFTILTLQDALTKSIRTPMVILFGAVTAVLLIVCVNVANLLLARGLRRQRELALRLSIGATRGRILQQLLTETLVLALCAGCIAIPLAWAAMRGLLAMAPAGIPRIETVSLDPSALAFAFLLALSSAMIFGVVPAFVTARRAPGEVMKAGGPAGGVESSRMRACLVIAEFAFSLVLLVAAVLLVKSFTVVARTPLGFHPENVLTMRGVLPGSRYDKQRRVALIEKLTTDCAALPGVTAAAAVTTLPLTGEHEGWGIRTVDNPSNWKMARVRAATPSYFRTMGIRLKTGREFTMNDRGVEPVAILSETAAHELWPGVADPVGRKLQMGRKPWVVVGVVEDTRASGLDADVRPYLYAPITQVPPVEFAIAVRTIGNAASLAGAVRAEFRRMDKDQPVTHVAVMTQLVADSIAPRRFQTVLMTLFAVCAVILAAIGIYGIQSYSVAQRTHEIGIRMALGAGRRTVLMDVLRQAAALALVGTVLGLVASFWVTPILRTLLYGTRAGEPWVFIGCAAVLLGVALLASAIPARRAAKLDPLAALRYE